MQEEKKLMVSGNRKSNAALSRAKVQLHFNWKWFKKNVTSYTIENKYIPEKD